MPEQNLGLKLNELEDDVVVAVALGDISLAVVKHNGSVRVLDGKCTHEGGPLGEGYMDKDELICPWHSGAFDVATGKASENTPWATDTKAYRTRVDVQTGDIFVDV